MSISEIISEAMHLKPQEIYILIENLVYSLDKPDSEIDEQWIGESIKRVTAYQNGTLKTISY